MSGQTSPSDRGPDQADLDRSERLNRWFLSRTQRLGDPESMVAAVIMTVWGGALALHFSSVLVVLILLTLVLTIHALAIESASHGGLWVATGLLLIVIVLVLTLVLSNAPPVFFAFGGASALAYQQLISLNSLRRRDATVDPRLVETNVLTVVGCSVLGILAATLAQVFDTTEQRSWLWVPTAVGCLLALGLAMTLLPARSVSAASRLRYRPGERIPPRPLTSLDPPPPSGSPSFPSKRATPAADDLPHAPPP